MLVMCFATIGVTSNAMAGIRAFWPEHSGTKVLPQNDSKVMPESLSLFGLRNETISFQIVVEADESGAHEVYVDLTRLGSLLGGPKGTIEIFREENVLVRERSHDLFWKPGSEAEPKGLSGSIPDRLIPQFSSTDIGANEQQVYWIDIWIPPETAAGHHRGKLRVTDDGTCQLGCTINVDLEILDLTIPDRPQSKTMLWFSGGEPDSKYVLARYFPSPDKVSESKKRALRLRHYHLARKHRITLFWEYHTLPSDELDSLLSGSAYSLESGYRGPGHGLGQDILAIRSYSGVVEAKTAAQWEEYRKSFPGLLDTFVYTMDEPPESEYPEVNRRTAASRPLSAFVTAPYDSELDADIFAAPSGVFSRSDAKRAEKAGKKMWIYNGSRPYSGSFAIDDVAVSTRVNPWIQYKAGIERWFYWESTYYLDFQGKRGAIDIGQEAGNFSNRHGDLLNGDGLLMYPGRDLLFPDNDVGIDGPLASIRLKNWRRGIEDVEYLVLARTAGFNDEVDLLLQTLLPKTLDETNESSSVSWPEDGKRWNLARRYLFELLKDGQSRIVLSELASPNPPGNSPERNTLNYLLIGALIAMLAALFVWRYLHHAS